MVLSANTSSNGEEKKLQKDFNFKQLKTSWLMHKRLEAIEWKIS